MRKLAMVSFSFSAAVFLSIYLPDTAAAPIGCALFAVAFVAGLLVLKGRPRLVCCLVCAGLACGFLWTQIYSAVFFAPARDLDAQTVRLQAVVTDYPSERDYGWQVSAVMKTEQGTSLKILLYLDEQGEHLRPGDRIESVTHCTLGSISSHGEEITYYTAKGIFLWGRCYGHLTVSRPERIPIRYWPAHLAHMLKDGIDRAFPERAAGIVRAVVTGSRDKLTDEFTSSLERTGLAHTVAVSGMHLSCFAGILVLLLGRGKGSTAALVIIWSLLFCGVAGATPSVTRAAMMIILLQLAPLMRRERDDATALGFALMLLLIWNPFSAAHVGLQLSFAAVAGIFLLAHRMQSVLLERLCLNGKPRKSFLELPRKLARGGVGVLCTTLCAMAATLPLTALHFGTVSLVAPLSNLLTLWAVTGVFAGGMAVGVLGIALPGVARILALPVGLLAKYVEGCSTLFSRFTFSALSMDSLYYRLWLIFAYVILTGLFFVRGKRRVIVPLCCITVSLTLSITLTAQQFRRGGLSCTVLDVGQGQSVLLRCGSALVLVDCGGDAYRNAGDTAADYLQSHGCSALDFLVLTHYHDDHANGVAQLLRRMDVGRLFVPDVEPDSAMREEILSLARERDIPVDFVRFDTSVTMGEEQSMKLYPPLNADKDANEQGLSALVSAGEFDVLITGDMSGESEQNLLSHAALPRTELLIAGHHGAKNSTSQELLDSIEPERCIISAGLHNRYGHPSDAVLERLSERNISVSRTDLNGTVTFTLYE